MRFTETELSLIKEAIDARLETGMFTEHDDVAGDIPFCSPSHEQALTRLGQKLATRNEQPDDEEV